MNKKPPKLTVVGADTVGNPPPRPLGPAGQRLWTAITAECVFDDAAGKELLCAACQALDRAEACREQIDADGEVIRQGGAIKEHPALRAELELLSDRLSMPTNRTPRRRAAAKGDNL